MKVMKILRTFYFALLHSIVTFGLLICGGSQETVRVPKMQKKAIRVITRIKKEGSCRQYF